MRKHRIHNRVCRRIPVRTPVRIAVLAVTFAVLLATLLSGGAGSVSAAQPMINLVTQQLETNRDEYLDSSVVSALPNTVRDSDQISLIIRLNEGAILDAYAETARGVPLAAFASSEEATEIRSRVAARKNALLSLLDKEDIHYTTGVDYSVLFCGFEITVTASDFAAIRTLFEDVIAVYVSERYSAPETAEADGSADGGILDGTETGYDGTGILVALVGTGLDVTHSAFSDAYFTADRSLLALTYDELSALSRGNAEGISAETLYVSDKLPFVYDYADSDCNVSSDRSDHGTHIAGIVAGKDTVLTGVAPNAQLAVMKVCSDESGTANASRILSALEDAVLLGADVISLSLGDAYGHARLCDEAFLNEMYKRVSDRGISIVIAAADSSDSAVSAGALSASCASSSDTPTLRLDETKLDSPAPADGKNAEPKVTPTSTEEPEAALSSSISVLSRGDGVVSAVSGNGYAARSGNTVAAANTAGAAALLHQYVKTNLLSRESNLTDASDIVSRLLTSSAEILFDEDGLPYSVLLQGAGLVNLSAALNADAFLFSGSADSDEPTDSTVLELLDDPERSGIYTMIVSIRNFGAEALPYRLTGYVLSETVAASLPPEENDGEQSEETAVPTTLVIESAQNAVLSADQNGIVIAVAPGETAEITLTLTLGDESRGVLDKLKYGDTVCGFLAFTTENDTEAGLNLPFLAYYGDFTASPILDTDYFAAGGNESAADTYATRVIGTLGNGYSVSLGSYLFLQDPTKAKIAPSADRIALSNQENAINTLDAVWAGLLRDCKTVTLTVSNRVTGEILFESVTEGVRKSENRTPSVFDIDLSALDASFCNNETYTVTLKADLQHETEHAENNAADEFSFPVTIDFEAPAVTGCEFYTERDTSGRLRYYAKLAVYDNHYTMALGLGNVKESTDGSLILNTFDAYLTPVDSSKNSVSYVIYDLTDHLSEIRASNDRNDSLTVVCYDCALNSAAYEIALPHDFTAFYFEEDEIVISPNELYPLSLPVYPETEWTVLLEYECAVPASGEVARVLNGTLVGVAPGETVLTARDPETGREATVTVRVLDEGDEGYKQYDKPVLDVFELIGYRAEKSFAFINPNDRLIGKAGDERRFPKDTYSLSLYPSESVTLRYILNAYFPEDVKVCFTSSDGRVAAIDESGTVTALSEGTTVLTARVFLDGQSTYYEKNVTVTVKNSHVTEGDTLLRFFGNGGAVVLPDSLAITEIADFAFSHYGTVTNADGSISYGAIGNDTVTSVVIPEGVTVIGAYAFANLTSLSRVVLPSTVKRIEKGAFAGCSALTTVEGIENVSFLGTGAFRDCTSLTEMTVNATVLSSELFAGCSGLSKVTLGKNVTEIGLRAFDGTALSALVVDKANTAFPTGTFTSHLTNQDGTTLLLVLPSVSGSFSMDDQKVISVADGAFAGCSALTSVSLPSVKTIGNAAFFGCSTLKTVTFGELTEIGDFAFYGTAISAHPSFLSLVALGRSAFAKTALTSVEIPAGLAVGENAFENCTALKSVTVGDGAVLGEGAFRMNADEARTYSFYTENGTRYYYRVYLSALKSVTVGQNVRIGDYAFYGAAELTTLSIGRGAVIGDCAFYNAASLDNINLSEVLSIGSRAFSGDVLSVARDSALTIAAYDAHGNALIRSYAPVLSAIDLSSVSSVGNGAFENCASLSAVDLSALSKIGDRAFAGTALTKVDLSSAAEIGDYAFSDCTSLISVKLNPNGTVIGDGAFQNCTSLSEMPQELESAHSVGDYAFAYTALTRADLSSAKQIGKHAFYKTEPVPFEVTLGSDLRELGDNPFAGCILAPFISHETIIFGDAEYELPVYTYTVSDTVRVIDGSLYRTVPNGLVLVTGARDVSFFTAASGTVRIGARAFLGSDSLTEVVLPAETTAIGAMAFYGCESLRLVSFGSYRTPSLEEEYDFSYFASGDHFAGTGKYTLPSSDGNTVSEKEGIGIIPYYIWNAEQNPTAVYYGASFIDHVGYVQNKLTVVRPVNGKSYDSLVLLSYADRILDGAAAADDITLAAIRAIDAIPELVTLADKPLVEAARAAYKLIKTDEQRLLVSNYDRLLEAERRISDLEFLEKPTEGESGTEEVDPPSSAAKDVTKITLFLLSSVAGLMMIVALVFATLLTRQTQTAGRVTPPLFSETGKNSASSEKSEQTHYGGALDCVLEPTEHEKENRADDTFTPPTDASPTENTASDEATHCKNLQNPENSEKGGNTQA